MTNFEKWKKDLTIDDIFYYDLVSDWEHPSIRCAENCPAAKDCPFALGRKKWTDDASHDEWWGTRVRCREYFMDWANKEEE